MILWLLSSVSAIPQQAQQDNEETNALKIRGRMYEEQKSPLIEFIFYPPYKKKKKKERKEEEEAMHEVHLRLLGRPKRV